MAPHLLLNEMAAPFELKLVDRENNEHKSAEYLKLNPSGLIPVLIDDGKPIHQTAAIPLHLTDKFPRAGLAPLPGRPNALRTTNGCSIFQIPRKPSSSLISIRIALPDDAQMAARVKHYAEQRIAGMLDLLDSLLMAHGPFLLGPGKYPRLISSCSFCRWTRMHANPATNRPHLKQLVETLAARPAVKKTFVTEGLPLPWY